MKFCICRNFVWGAYSSITLEEFRRNFKDILFPLSEFHQNSWSRYIQGVPPISTQVWFQFLIFLILLSKTDTYSKTSRFVQNDIIYPHLISSSHSIFQPSDYHAKHHIRPHLLYTTGSDNQNFYFTCNNMKFELIYSYLLVVITVSFSLHTTTKVIYQVL